MNKCCRKSHIRSGGFTLIEAVVVVAILGVLAALAGPPMGDLVARYKNQTTSEQLSTLFQRAQTEALRRNGFVQLVKIPSATCPANDDWSCGVQLNVDEMKNNSWSPLARLDIPRGIQLRNVSAMNGGGSGASSLAFDRWGRPSNANQPAFLLINPSSPSANVAFCAHNSGRVRVVKQPNLSDPCA